jgi:hypothetical protein
LQFVVKKGVRMVEGASDPIPSLERFSVTANHNPSALQGFVLSVFGRETEGEIEGGSFRILIRTCETDSAGGKISSLGLPTVKMDGAYVIEVKSFLGSNSLGLSSFNRQDSWEFDF